MAKLWRRQREAAAHLIRFLERMRGARTAAPSREAKPPPLDGEAMAELARLRAENAQLRGENSRLKGELVGGSKGGGAAASRVEGR